jgi:hypothetical protein
VEAALFREKAFAWDNSAPLIAATNSRGFFIRKQAGEQRAMYVHDNVMFLPRADYTSSTLSTPGADLSASARRGVT